MRLWTSIIAPFIYCFVSFSSVQAIKYGLTYKPCSETTKQHFVQWTGGQFDFPTASTKTLLKHSGQYLPRNVVATRAQLVGDIAFLALPRYRQGIPATLVRASVKPSGSVAGTFKAFPAWDMQEEGNCKALQSVVDVVVDQNAVLWVLDTGVVNTLEIPVRRCPAKVVAISVRTGKILKTISLEALTTSRSRLQYLVVEYDTDGACFVYVSDAANRAILVYNLHADRGYRVLLPERVNGANRALDVLYTALIRKEDGNAELYFTYLSASRLYKLRTEYLRNGMAEGQVIDLGKKPTRIVIIGTDNGSAMFFRSEGDSNVFRWDTKTPFVETNFKSVYRSSICQLATHAVPDYKRNTMRVLQSNFPDYMQNRMGCGAIQQLAMMQSCY